jgi:hypothetical protein
VLAVLPVVLLAASLAPAGSLAASAPRTATISPATAGCFPATCAPNDPNYNPAERGVAGKTWNDEQWYLYSFMPSTAPLATDPENASGMSVDAAWAKFGAGRDDVTVAYMEGGVNWRIAESCELRLRAYLNRGELPYPENAQGRTKPQLAAAGTVFKNSDPYDLSDDGVFNVDDYKDDPRVLAGVLNVAKSPPGGPYLHHVCSVAVPGSSDITSEDLIVAFGHCQISAGQLVQCPTGGKFDNDGNGYPGDISGWNFNRDTNDPQTDQSVYAHFDGEAAQVVGEANNGFAGVGLCPYCRFLPVKAGDEAIDRPDRVAEAIVFAVNSGVRVITAVIASLGLSPEVKAALDYAYHRGVVVAWASNDFESADHTDGMFYPHVWPGNSITGDQSTRGTACPPLCNVLLDQTFRSRSSLTSYGPHSLFAVPNNDGSTSTGTPTQAGVAALVVSEGLNAADAHLISGPLNADEVKQVVRATASNIDSASLAFPGVPGATFNVFYGYGRPNVLKATQAVHDGKIPPTADIRTPDWYQDVDPTKQGTLHVAADIAALRAAGGAYTWQLQYATGAQPLESDFRTFASGSGAGAGQAAGDLDLGQIPSSFFSGAYATTADRTSIERYDVTIRVQVRDPAGLMGEDRRAVHVRHDDTEQPGFPIKLGVSGESSPSMADIEGRGWLDTIVATSDGDVQAFRPDGSEAPGFPVHTGPAPGMNPGYDMNYLGVPAWRDGLVPRPQDGILSATAVGDLRHDGGLDIVAGTMSGYTYAWDGSGHLLPGFPVLDGKPAYFHMSVPPPDTPYSFNPENVTGAAPVLADLEGTKQLDIIQGAGDGKLYAWRPDGSAVPGWPVDTAPAAPPANTVYARDVKIVPTPAIVDIDGDGRPDVLVSLVDTSWPSNNPAGAAPVTGYVDAFYAQGTTRTPSGMIPGWPVKLTAAEQGYGVAQDFVTQGVQSPVVFDTPAGPQAVANPNLFLPQRIDLQNHQVFQPMAGAALPPSTPTSPALQIVQFTTSPALGNVLGGPLPQLFQAGSSALDVVSGITQLPGEGTRVDNGMAAWDPLTGAVLPHYVQPIQGLAFFGAPAIADVTGDGTPDILQSGDSGALMGFDGTTGQAAAGFPKWTGGFSLWTPAVGDVDGKGTVEVAAATREGYLHMWRTPGRTSADVQAWHWHQDDRNTGHYGTDTRPPAGIADLAVTAGDVSDTLAFTAPGDNWNDGTAAAYQVAYASAPIYQDNFAAARHVAITATPGPAGTKESLKVPHVAGHTYYAVRAVDAAGNIGPVARRPIVAGPQPPRTGDLVLPNTAGGAGGYGFLALLLLAALGMARLLTSRRPRAA